MKCPIYIRAISIALFLHLLSARHCTLTLHQPSQLTYSATVSKACMQEKLWFSKVKSYCATMRSCDLKVVIFVKDLYDTTINPPLPCDRDYRLSQHFTEMTDQFAHLNITPLTRLSFNISHLWRWKNLWRRIKYSLDLYYFKKKLYST